MRISHVFFMTIVLLMSSCSFAAGTGVQLDRTRLVIDKGNTNGSFGFLNDSGSYNLVSTWVENYDGSVSDAFVVSPSVYQMADKQRSINRVVKVGNLPEDRESVFWISVRAIPAAPKTEGNQAIAQFALTQKIKLFYRPKGIEINNSYAASQLKLANKKNKIIINNPNPISMVITSVKADGKDYKVPEMIAPFSSISIPAKTNINRISHFTYINEYGGYIDYEIK